MTAVSFDMPMPVRTQRRHARGAEWRGDEFSFIDAASHSPLGPDGIRAVDMNFTGKWNLHDGTPKGSNYPFVIDRRTGHTRKMTHRERRTHVFKWSDGAARWRRGPRADSTRPHTYAEVVAYAARRGVVVTAELKAPISLALARAFVAEAKAANHPPFFMAMLRQRLRASTHICQEKCSVVIAAGGKFAVIHGARLIGRANRRISGRVIAGWHTRPTRIW